MDMNLLLIFALGALLGYYIGSKAFRDKINGWLMKSKKKTCTCGQVLKADQQFCPKCGNKREEAKQ